MEHLILPPKVRGEVCAFLQVGCDSVKFENYQIAGPIGVYLLWWGQDTTQQVCLSPPILPQVQISADIDVLNNHKGIKTVGYHIVAEEDQFKNYLTDARHLFLQVRNANDVPFGFSAVQNLHRLIEFSGIHDIVPIYSCLPTENENKDSQIIGHIRIWMTYDVAKENNINNDSESSVNDNVNKISSSLHGDSNKMNSYDTCNPTSRLAPTIKQPINKSTKNATGTNRSKPFLLVSKRTTPIRNPYRRPEKTIRTSNPVTRDQNKKQPVIDEFDYSHQIPTNNEYYASESRAGKKNVSFLDEVESETPANVFDQIKNQHIPSVGDDNRYVEIKNAKENEIDVLFDTNENNYRDLQSLIARSHERIASNQVPNSNWKQRELLLREKDKYQTILDTKEIQRNTASKPHNLNDTERGYRTTNIPDIPPNKERDNLNSEQAIHQKQYYSNNTKSINSIEPIIPNNTNQMSSNQRIYPLPSWNLSTERLKYIVQVNCFTVNVKSMTFKPAIYPRVTQISARNSNPRWLEHTKGSSKGISTQQYSNVHANSLGSKAIPKRTIQSKPTTATPPTFFITYSIPPEREDTNVCSKRAALEKRHLPQISNEITFNGSSKHHIRFNNQVLDSWWISNVEFKVHCRSLNQRVPTFIGSASLKLKYLLMNEKYTCDSLTGEEAKNAGMRLPIFASTSLKQELKADGNTPFWTNDQVNSPSEILGEILISFSFAKETEKQTSRGEAELSETRLHNDFANRFQPAEKDSAVEIDQQQEHQTPQTIPSNLREDIIVREADKQVEKINNQVKDMHNELSANARHASNVLLNPEIRNVESKPKVAVNQACTSKNVENSQDFNITNMQNAINSENLICLLRVPEGKNFSSTLTMNSKNDSRLSCNSLTHIYIACRIFSSGNLIRSQANEYDLQSGNTRAAFNFQHCMSFLPDIKFLTDICKDNYLIIETWATTKIDGYRCQKELIGISSISLHKIYTSFQDRHQLTLSRNLELPVMITNGWIPVNNLLDGRYVGHIRVLFAVGYHSQVHNLCQILKLPMPTNVELLDNDGQDQGQNFNRQEYEQSKAAQEHRNIENYNVSTVTRNTNSSSSLSDGGQETLLKQREDVQKTIAPHTTKLLRLNVSVLEGRNLPLITGSRYDAVHGTNSNSSKQTKQPSSMPNTYVTLPRAFNDNLSMNGNSLKNKHSKSNLVSGSSNPRWEMNAKINCPVELLTDPRRHLIIKVWHRPHTSSNDYGVNYQQESVSAIDDYVLGFAAIDVSPLLREGYTADSNEEQCHKDDALKQIGLCGWYNLMDFVGRRRGQIKITINPDLSSDDTRIELLKLKETRKSFIDITSQATNEDFKEKEDLKNDNRQSRNLDTPSYFKYYDVNKFRPKDYTSMNHHPTVSSGSEEVLAVVHDQITIGHDSKEYGNYSESYLNAKNLSPSPKSHWKMPEIPLEHEDATRSFLASKLTDLDDLAEKLKLKLIANCSTNPDSNELAAKATSDTEPVICAEGVNSETRQSVTCESQERQTLSQLRVSITEQLSLMQEHLMKSRSQSNTKDALSLPVIASEQLETIEKTNVHPALEVDEVSNDIVVPLFPEKEKEKFAAANPIPESQYQLDLSIISEQSENFGAYSRDSPTSSISIEESGDTFLIPDFHNDKASACSHNSINHNEVGNDNEGERRSRMEPDGAGNPSPVNTMVSKT